MILASRRNYLMVGESIDPNDWKPGVTADQIYQRVTDGVHHEDGHIILLHDAGGVTRKATIQALPRIITTLQKEGYRLEDLEKAEKLSVQTGKKAMELIRAKGKASDNRKWSDVVKKEELQAAETTEVPK